jgi:hypothetical protein
VVILAADVGGAEVDAGATAFMTGTFVEMFGIELEGT